jgi:SAM-dependent methyltransferase
LLGDVRGKRILDVGAGEGIFSRMLIDYGFADEVLAVDGSAEMIMRAEGEDIPYTSRDKDYTKKIHHLQCRAEKFPHYTDRGFDDATAILFFNYLQTRKDLRAVFRRVYDNLKKGARFIAFQNHFADVSFEGGKVGNVEYVYDGKNEDGAGLFTLKRRAKSGKTIELKLTDWRQEDYEEASRRAGFSGIEWHSPIVSQEGMDTMPKEFWADYIRAGLFRGFVARK